MSVESESAGIGEAAIEREPCKMCDGKGGVNEAQGEGVYVGLKCPRCFGFGSEEIVDLIWEALVNSMGPDWTERLGAQYVADALSDAGFARQSAAAPTMFEALRNIAGQAGALRAFEFEIREVAGNTNWQCLIDAITKADAVLNKALGK